MIPNSVSAAVAVAMIQAVIGLVMSPVSKFVQHFVQSFKWCDPDYWTVCSKYCENLTELAKMNKGQDAIGRDDEISMLINTLSVDGKANVCITGDPGVGKTALVEGLAYRIATGNVPEHFKNKKIIKVNMVSLIAGTAYSQGDGAVNRMRALFDNAKEDTDIILFIDEFHQIVQCNAAELFKTYLDRPGVHVIAATTTAEYSYISQDPALERRFKKLILDEPDKNQTFNILKNIKNKIETNINVKINDSALMSAIDLTDKYMKGRTYPDKAIDVLNHAAQFVSKQSNRLNKDLMFEVTEEDIQKIITSETGIPLGDITDAEAKHLNTMEERVASSIIGQNSFISTLCDAVRKSRSGFAESSKPRSSFLLTGTPGVGKTALAECIGNELGNVIKLDAANSDLSDSFLDQVWKKPYSLVLFDNLDRAKKSVFDKIFGILEGGFAYDSHGRKIDFTNSIVVMTANTGSDIILKDDGKDAEVMREQVLERVENDFGMNFTNKLDDILVFNKLEESIAKDIIKIFVDRIESQLSLKNIKLEIDDDVLISISKVKIDHKKGANSLNKIIDERISKPISMRLIKGEIKSGDIVLCSMDGDNIKFEIIHKK